MKSSWLGDDNELHFNVRSETIAYSARKLISFSVGFLIYEHAFVPLESIVKHNDGVFYSLLEEIDEI